MRYTRPLRSRADVEAARRKAGECALEVGFSEARCGEAVLVCSELATNTIEHGGGGDVVIETIETGERNGLRMEFTDYGPGIPDVDRALTVGFSTSGGLGEGLPLARRLSDQFELRSVPGNTRITVTLWSR